MRAQEVMQHMQQRSHVRAVAGGLRSTDIVHDHCTDALRTAICHQQILGQLCRCDLGDVLMLGNCEHFLLRETAQTQTVFERDHVKCPCIQKTH